MGKAQEVSMTETTGKLLTDEPREREVAQLRVEIASAYEAMYHTLAELDRDDPQVRHRYVQDCRTRMAGYNAALGALIGVAAAGEALYALSGRALKHELELVRNSERPERCRTLWMLVCCEKQSEVHEMVPFYAANAEDAEKQAQCWLNANPRSLVRLDLRAYPRGFMMGWRMLDGMIL
jgi:hypothetical protein